jgi:hypothetical protein
VFGNKAVITCWEQGGGMCTAFDALNDFPRPVSKNKYNIYSKGGNSLKVFITFNFYGT